MHDGDDYCACALHRRSFEGAKRSYSVVLEVPSSLILALLAFVAIFAPVLAPHSKLDPVPPTREQCLARYNWPAVPTSIMCRHSGRAG